jgi:hypothetical protein
LSATGQRAVSAPAHAPPLDAITAREEKLVYRTVYLMLLSAIAALALIVTAPATAAAPAKETSTVTFGPFVDDEACEEFGITVTVERTRTTITFADGDVTRHTELLVTSSANGKAVVSRNAFNVFIDADAPTEWVITGVFEKGQLDGRAVWLQSGRLVYDLEADRIDDPNPGPLAQPPDVCELLKPE